jgi:hypothetical protein
MTTRTTHAALTCPALSCLALSLLAGTALARPIQVVAASRDHDPSGPLSLIPGSTTIRYSNFSRMDRSEEGTLWNTIVSIADPADAATTRDQIHILGNGLSITLAAREGVTEVAPGEFFDFTTNLPIARVNNSGNWAIAMGNATNGRVVRVVNGVPSVLARSQSAANAPYDQFVVSWGELRDASINNANGVGFLSTNQTPNVFIGTESIFSSVTNAPAISILTEIPTGQANGATNPVADVDAGTFMEAAGDYIFVGELQTASTEDKILVRNGVVRLQEGSPVPGSTFTSPVSSISASTLEPDGTWLARGSNADGTSWVLVNGNVVARSGGPIFAGSTENWSSFIDVKADNAGNYVIVGNTNNTDSLLNSVAVYNNERVILRESQGVDFSGDDSPDLFLGTFRDRCTFATDGFFYFAFSLKSSASATANITGNRASLMRISVAAECDDIDFNNDNLFPDDNDLVDFLTVLAGGPCSPGNTCNDIDFNNDNLFPDDTDLIAFLTVLAGGSC